MPGGNEKHTGTGLTLQEESCLRALIAGKDAWPDFIGIYSRFIYSELIKRQITNQQDQADLMQELALKLVSHDCVVIRRFLERASGFSFSAVLRPMIASIVIDEWRRGKRWCDVLLCEDEPTLQQLCRSDGDGDPAMELYREMRITSLLLKACGPSNRQCFLTMYLRYVDDLNVNQIGARLGLSANAVSQRLGYYSRKLKKLGWSEVQHG